jgi:hypothetical protein
MDSTSVNVVEPSDIKEKWAKKALDHKCEKKHGVRLDGIITTLKFVSAELGIIKADNTAAGREDISYVHGTIVDAQSGIATMIEELEYMEPEILNIE